jgi:hypothetical protein
MASYGVFLAACGFEYHGPKGRLGFAPRVSPENFKAPFTTAEGWGSFSQRVVNGRQSVGLEMRHGKLKLNELVVGQVAETAADRAVVAVGGKEVPALLLTLNGRFVVRFPIGLSLEAGQRMEVSFVK